MIKKTAAILIISVLSVVSITPARAASKTYKLSVFLPRHVSLPQNGALATETKNSRKKIKLYDTSEVVLVRNNQPVLMRTVVVR